MTQPFVSIVVPFHNGREHVKDCLESLLRQNYPADSFEMIAVNNGSTDGSEEIVKNYPVRLLTKPHPLGCSVARNAGIRQARGEVIACTDIDCIADPCWLQFLVEGWEEQRYGGFVGCVVPAPSVNPIEGWMADFYDQERNLLMPPLPLAQTNNVAYRRRLFSQIGGFDENMRWCEDVGFSWRMMRDTPYEFKWNPKALITHRNRSTLKEAGRKFFCRGYGTAANMKRYPALFTPPLFSRWIRHVMNACVQFLKLLARWIMLPLTDEGYVALLRVKFWLTFHLAMAVGLAMGWMDPRNAHAMIPDLSKGDQS